MNSHTEWLSLVEVSGPFLTVPVLEKAFPQGLESVETPRRSRLRSAYEEWREAIDDADSLIPELHREWIWMVITELLGYDSYSLIPNSDLELPYSVTSPERSGIFQPNWVVKINQDEKPRLFISTLPPEINLETTQQDDGWPNSFIERMTLLCRTNGVRLGLLTNGERWVLVNAPIGETSSHTSWYSRLWFQEPITLKAFQSLLGVRRCFGPPEEALDALLEESLKHQDDVTDTLGEQVRRAVEVLIQCLDKADQDRNRTLLQDVTTTELYEAGLTVMMRLVFLLCAEERGLLLLGDPIYDQHYAISTIRGQLVEDADRYGPEMLERRYDAWARLLAVFRMIYGGIDHESLRMPALGGSLFDPDRFAFLEGRQKGTYWSTAIASPLPIDNRTVLLLLDSLLILKQQGGALLLSYRALDVEQIGHVYEGLLEQTVIRVPEVTLGLVGSQKAKNPNLSLNKLEMALAAGEENIVSTLKTVTERSEATIRNALIKSEKEVEINNRLLAVCGGDVALARRIQPYIYLIRTDAWNDPIVYHANSFTVTVGVDRRETGTHYTPRSLTEVVVANTLEPLVYNGPVEGKPRNEWVLKSSADLLDLKICDPAMGSGAFLVQACRWLAERLVEAWFIDEENGKVITINGSILDNLESKDPLPNELDERLLLAKQLIAEKCLYGVDVNPMAVELAKLSIWLITLVKNRPFSFLEHNLRHGDSLLGIYRLDQLTMLSINPDKGYRQLSFFSESINKLVSEAVELRKNLREIQIKDVHDVETMSRLDKNARKKLEKAEMMADAMILEALRTQGNSKNLEEALDALAEKLQLVGALNETKAINDVAQMETNFLDMIHDRKPFHWPLEFPEVFLGENGGFDAIIGNPPFIGGRRMRGIIGDEIVNWLASSWPHASMNADLSAFFYLRSALLIRDGGSFGLLATKTIGQGDTARTGLSFLIEQKNYSIYYAKSSFPWPGTASVTAALVVARKGNWNGLRYLDGRSVMYISPILDDQDGWGKSYQLPGNKERSFQGSVLVGMGFVLTNDEAKAYIKERAVNGQVVLPYLNGEDINSHPEQKASRWAIDFRNKSLDECKEKWPELLERIFRLVKPQRDSTRREAHRKYWWHHGDKRPALYDFLKKRSEVFVVSRVTKYVAIVSVPANQIISDRVYVFDLPSWASFAALQCSFHDKWVRRGSSTVGERLHYTPTDYFDTYPFLQINGTEVESVGRRYHEYRKNLMINRNLGLTDVYNRFNDPDDNAEDIQKLRDLHKEMDEKVAIAFGWEDLDLGHNFYESKLGVRYTISNIATQDVLQRLLILNHECYKKEVKNAVNKKKNKSSTTKRVKPNDQLTLFNINDGIE